MPTNDTPIPGVTVFEDVRDGQLKSIDALGRVQALTPLERLMLEEITTRNHSIAADHSPGSIRVGPFELRPFCVSVQNLELVAPRPHSYEPYKLKCILRALDRNHGQACHVYSEGDISRLLIEHDHAHTAKALYMAIYNVLREAMLHEIDELIWFNGKPVKDPHEGDK